MYNILKLQTYSKSLYMKLKQAKLPSLCQYSIKSATAFFGSEMTTI